MSWSYEFDEQMSEVWDHFLQIQVKFSPILDMKQSKNLVIKCYVLFCFYFNNNR